MRPLTRPYLQHGSRHGPTGSDPIPGLAFADYAGLAWFGSQNIVANSEDAIPWTEFDTSNTAVFGTDQFASPTPPPRNASGDESLLLLAAGVYIIFAAVEWEVGAVNVGANLDVFRQESDFISSEDLAISELLTTTTGARSERLAPSSYRLTSVGTGDYGGVSLNVMNKDTSDWHVTNATMAAIYIPTSGDIANVY